MEGRTTYDGVTWGEWPRPCDAPRDDRAAYREEQERRADALGRREAVAPDERGEQEEHGQEPKARQH